MKRNLTILVLTLLVTGVFAQNEMLNLPSGSAGISSTTSGNGVAIGPGFTAPEARLHTRLKGTSGIVSIFDMENELIGFQDGTSAWVSPDFFIQARSRDNAIFPSNYGIRFSVDKDGKIQSGFYNAAINDQLAVRNNLGIYASVNRTLKFDLTNNAARMIWESPNDNFQFVNGDNSTVALQLGEMGQVGINTTGTWTNDHKLHVIGSALSDGVWVQNGSDWNSDDKYFGMEFSDRPEIRWKSDTDKYFEFKSVNTGEVPLRLSSAGKVGINTDNFGESNHSLYIAGSSIAEEMFVKLSDDWGDFVFEKEYDLMPLDELEHYLEENKHLPDFPSAAEVEKDGLALGETERLLTIKVEELTLYILELKKEIDTLKEEIKD
ncbi:MAG: hypothetical protein WBG42_01430 [Cryomorphaceae bacterium]